MEKKILLYAISIMLISFVFATYLQNPTGNVVQKDDQLQLHCTLCCNLKDRSIPGTQLPSYSIQSVDTHVNIVAYLASNSGIWIYDLGPNLRLDLDANGNPSGDDRGPMQIFSVSSQTNVAYISAPSVYGTKIAYSYTIGVPVIGTDGTIFIEVYDIGQDKIAGTSDDTKTSIYTTKLPCSPFGTPCDPSSSIFWPYVDPKIRGDILSWYEHIDDVTPPYPIISTAYWCDIVNSNNPSYCGFGVSKIFANRATAMSDLFVSRANQQNSIDAAWIEFPPYSPAKMHIFTNGIESIPYQQNQNQQRDIFDFLSHTLAFYTFEEMDRVGYLQRYAAAINNPNGRLSLTQQLDNPKMSQTLFTNSKSARDPGLLIGSDPQQGYNLRVARMTPSISSIIISDTTTRQSYREGGYAVYGNNILFIEESAQGSALKYTQCYGD